MQAHTCQVTVYFSVCRFELCSVLRYFDSVAQMTQSAMQKTMFPENGQQSLNSVHSGKGTFELQLLSKEMHRNNLATVIT